ncbi:MAG TPA: hypothetical protein VFG73_08615 [Rhodanobacteraceae bacterium]|nr:hypothetical protein [Rhodanobacteraceae bacterium]
MKAVAAAVLVALLAGCASYRPLVMQSSITDPATYESDLARCQGYAHSVSPGARAGVGAVIGGLLGAALGAAVGDSGIGRDLARYGAVQGAASGAASGARDQVTVIRRCMTAKGYVVLR